MTSRPERLELRLTAAEKRSLRLAAAHRGLSMSGWLRQVALLAAHGVLHKEVSQTVSIPRYELRELRARLRPGKLD